MKPQLRNVKELIELIDRYESISLKEIKNTWISTNVVANKLTGFGDSRTCSLCKKVGYSDFGSPNCKDCVFEIQRGCSDSNRECYDTYYGISLSKTPEDLLQAYRNRAAYLKERFKELIKNYRDDSKEKLLKEIRE